MGEITWDLISFYAVASCIFFIFYMHKLKDKKTALLLTSMTIFVAREYYEIPVFVTGYLRLGNPHLPMIFHHLLVFLIFIVLVSYSKIKFTKTVSALLLVTPVLLSPLLLSSIHSIFSLYLARTIGLTVFGGVFIHGCSLVGT